MKEHQPIDQTAVTFLKFLCLREYYRHIADDRVTIGQLMEWFTQHGYIIDHTFDVSQEMWNEVYKVQPHETVVYAGKVE